MLMRDHSVLHATIHMLFYKQNEPYLHLPIQLLVLASHATEVRRLKWPGWMVTSLSSNSAQLIKLTSLQAKLLPRHQASSVM